MQPTVLRTVSVCLALLFACVRPALAEPTGWGFIDKTGKVVVSPRFGQVGSFSGGLAAVELDEKWGFINKSGITVIDPQFSGAGDFGEGLAAVRGDYKWG